MTKEVGLLTPLSIFEELHLLADSRKGMVEINRQVLTQLLVDHAVLVTACKGAGIKVLEPTPKRVRAKLK